MFKICDKDSLYCELNNWLILGKVILLKISIQLIKPDTEKVLIFCLFLKLFLSNVGLYSCNYPLFFLHHQSVILCWIKQIIMQICSNISHLLIKTTVPWPINCPGYIILCIFRTEFEEVTFFRCFYFLASSSPLNVPLWGFPPPFPLSTPIKTIFFIVPATSPLLNSRACFSPSELDHWAQFMKPPTCHIIFS